MNTRRRGRKVAAALVALSLGFVAGPVAATAGAGEGSPHKPKAGNFVAQATGPAVSIYEKPTSTTPTSTMANPTPTDGRLVFLVDKIRSDGWIKVLLPVRPNGTTGWILLSEVAILYDPYRIVVDLSDHELTLYKSKKLVERIPVGIGKDTTPTPGGRYYITQLFEPPDPNGAYGPFAYALSGFSEVLTSFKGGEAIIGLHGTNRPDLIGEDVSSGCIRMDNDAIRRVRALLPLGTPVSIRD